MKQIVSFSGGKDSLAMLLMMIGRGETIDGVVFFDTGWEFPEVLETVDKVEKQTGIHIDRIRHWRLFNDLNARYGYPHKSGGWCTAAKRDTINKYMRYVKSDNKIECIGFACDEKKRSERINKKWKVRFPLIEYGITGMEALEYCYKKGYDWGGLYNWMPSKRVSCFCCPKQSKADYEALRINRPELYRKYLRLRAVDTGVPVAEQKIGQRALFEK